MYKYNVLVVDDEVEIPDAIEIYLRKENISVFKAYDGIKALDILDKERIDLVIMDVMMPRLDGIDTTMKIRETKQIPIIMLTAKSEFNDKIVGLNIGADDYITKPFYPLELVARVKAQLRRYDEFGSINNSKEIIVIGEIELDIKSKQLKVNEEIKKVTPLEYKILEVMMSNPNRVYSAEELYEIVWGDVCINTDTVMVHVRRIREKIEDNPKNPKYLKVVWGIGYKFESTRK